MVSLASIRTFWESTIEIVLESSAYSLSEIEKRYGLSFPFNALVLVLVFVVAAQSLSLIRGMLHKPKTEVVYQKEDTYDTDVLLKVAEMKKRIETLQNKIKENNTATKAKIEDIHKAKAIPDILLKQMEGDNKVENDALGTLAKNQGRICEQLKTLEGKIAERVSIIG